MSATTQAPQRARRPAEPGWRERINEHPMAPYFMILGSAMLLLVLGLVMVLSSSAIESYDIHKSAFTLFTRQAIVAVVGVGAMVVIARMPVAVLRRLTLVFLAGSFVMLLLVFVPGIGVSVNGQRNWINFIGPFRLQPSEFAKLALILWAAHVFAQKDAVLDRWRELAVPFLPVAAALVLLVVAEGDVGTAIVISLIVMGLLFVAGAPMRIFVALGVIGLAGIAALSLTAGYRMRRFTAWLAPEDDLKGAGWQLIQGKYALGTGGWWGVGLGGSREKWGALPEAHTDFIFPVIGEELGLFGALTVIGLFAALSVFTLRMAIRTTDPFVRVASVGIMVWLVGQALVNLGAVLQLMPITGVPLPFVSYGGSSLLPSLMAVGVLLAFARREAMPDLAGRARRRPARRAGRAGRDPDAGGPSPSDATTEKDG